MKLVFTYLPNSDTLYVSLDNKRTWTLMDKTRKELLQSGYNFYKDSCINLTEIYIKDEQGFISKPEYNSFLDVCYEEEEEDTCIVSINSPTEVIHGAFNSSKEVLSLQVQDIKTEDDLVTLRQVVDSLSPQKVDLSSTYFEKGLDLGTIFKGCNNLTGITITEGTTAIKDDAFSDCSSLKKVFIPKETTVSGNNAFLNCSLTADTLKFQDADNWVGFQPNDFNRGTKIDTSGYIERYELLPNGTYNVILKEGQYSYEELEDGTYNLVIPTASLFLIQGSEEDETALYNLV